MEWSIERRELMSTEGSQLDSSRAPQNDRERYQCNHMTMAEGHLAFVTGEEEGTPRRRQEESQFHWATAQDKIEQEQPQSLVADGF